MRRKGVPPDPAAAASGPGDVPDRATFSGRTLARWRRYLGVERLELAYASGVSESMLRYAERGDWPMSGRLFNRVAHVLDVPAAVLVAYAPDDERARVHAMVAAVRAAARRLERAGRYAGGEGAA